MPYCICRSDNESVDNAFLCEYYGVLPALVALEEPLSPSPSIVREASEADDRFSPKSSLFTLVQGRSIPGIFETAGVPPQPRGTVRVVIVSDTHERHRDMNLPAGDILLHGGDILEGFNILHQPLRVLADFFDWLNAQPHAVKIFVAGNHDRQLSKMKKDAIRTMSSPALYLENEAALVQPIGLRIFGSPRSVANSRLSPNGAYQGKSWWTPMPTPTPPSPPDATTAPAADVRTLRPPLALSVELEGPQPLGPVDVLLTHQSAEFGTPQEIAAQPITKFVTQVAPRRLHCAGHLHASHGLHKLPVPPTLKEHYGLRAAHVTTDKADVDVSHVKATVPVPFLPSLNATMLLRVGMRDILQRPCVVDIEL